MQIDNLQTISSCTKEELQNITGNGFYENAIEDLEFIEDTTEEAATGFFPGAIASHTKIVSTPSE